MRRRLVTVLLAMVAATLAIPASAVADAQGGETLHGQIRQPDTVEGVEITVFDGDEEIGTAVTDTEGTWEVELPGPGIYRAVVNEDSVPGEYVVAETPGVEQEDLDVRSGQERGVIFNLAHPGEEAEEEAAEPEGAPEAPPDAAEEEAAEDEEVAAPEVDRGAPFVDRLSQTALQGLLYGMVIAMAAVGLSLIFGTTRMINFAHGDMVTFGAMMALLFSSGAAGLGNTLLGVLAAILAAIGAGMLLRGRLPERGVLAVQGTVLALGIVGSALLGTFGEELQWRIPLIPAAVLAVVLGAALGAGMERYIWRPLRKRNVALIQMFIVSIGLALLLRHVLLVLFGGGRASYREYQIQQTWSLGPLSITPRDFAIVTVAAAVLILVACMLQFTRIGKAMRAVSDNRDLAESSGIDVDRVTLYVWGLGGGLAALGGTLFGLSVIVHWQMGFHLLLLMFAAVILGGLGTAYGAMVGGIFIGLIAMLSTLWFPTQLMEAWALALMIIMLLVRPQGILGRRERVG